MKWKEGGSLWNKKAEENMLQMWKAIVSKRDACSCDYGQCPAID